MPVLGFWDILIIGFLVLLVFGPKRLPQMGRALGGTFRGFKDAITERHEREDAKAEELPAAQAPGLPQPAPQTRDRDTLV